MLLNIDWHPFPIILCFNANIEIFTLIKTIPVKINYIFKNLYNILSKDEKGARVDETKIVKR